MRKLSLIAAALAFSANAMALEVGGVDVPETLKTDTQELALNGAGVRDKFFMDLYVGSLYLTKKQSDAASIISDDDVMALRLNIISDLITGEKMTEATLEGFQKATSGDTVAIQAKIDEFMKTFQEEIKKGDSFDMVYVPNEGVKVYKNEKYAKTISGLAFKKALFGIWLSKEPVQKSLKEEMLGG